ncbi:Cyclin-dependent kinases regulatory subunit like [Actinidia chinensis var. chinensis]|uniref:Cyclin-dependent kinases regulatory subunit like n=1 Tax=Actinidia chinensis var. chinensis TaxID=1590841 RepID=A0A2R6QT14_ACTCC|nr:Cyclin-dependent kinases regulatory subunit like [Actinidia chinensis var. chinensis]
MRFYLLKWPNCSPRIGFSLKYIGSVLGVMSGFKTKGSALVTSMWSLLWILLCLDCISGVYVKFVSLCSFVVIVSFALNRS